MSSIVLGISCTPTVVRSGESISVVLTYDYDSTKPGRLTLEADIPADAGERIQIAPPTRSCESGDGKSATYALKIEIPAAWQPGTYAVKLTAKLTEGTEPPFRLRRLAACFIVKP